MKTIIKKNMATRELEKSALNYLKTKNVKEESHEAFFSSGFTPLARRMEKMFIPYFTKKDNSRFDDLIDNMMDFFKAYKRAMNGKTSRHISLQKKYWKNIAEQTMQEAKSTGDRYLINTVNYFHWKMKQLS